MAILAAPVARDAAISRLLFFPSEYLYSALKHWGWRGGPQTNSLRDPHSFIPPPVRVLLRLRIPVPADEPGPALPLLRERSDSRFVPAGSCGSGSIRGNRVLRWPHRAHPADRGETPGPPWFRCRECAADF